MKSVYLKVYELIWLCVTQHCSRMFSVDQKSDTPSPNQELNWWLEEIGDGVLDNLDSLRKKTCMIRLVKTYIASLKVFKSIHQEFQLRDAQQSLSKSSLQVRIGKYSLLALLVLSTALGMFVTYSYQMNDLQITSFATIVAVLSYIAIAWGAFAARALPHFKLILLSLIAFTGSKTFFWDLWITYVSTTGNCYSEFCILISPSSIFQSTTISLSMIAFWSLFLILLSFQNPIKTYLTYKKSTNRRL